MANAYKQKINYYNTKSNIILKYYIKNVLNNVFLDN